MKFINSYTNFNESNLTSDKWEKYLKSKHISSLDLQDIFQDYIDEHGFDFEVVIFNENERISPTNVNLFFYYYHRSSSLSSIKKNVCFITNEEIEIYNTMLKQYNLHIINSQFIYYRLGYIQIKLFFIE